MMHEDALYLRRCLELARLGGTAVQTNPRVGALLVHEGRIIGEGWHERFGEGHAEVNAVASVREADRHLIAKSTLFVSLEPCNHVGKTPACTSLILENKIPVVVVGSVDPNPKMGGRSLDFLRNQGVEVRLSTDQSPFRELNRAFWVNQREGRPYLVLKWAESRDGFIAGLDPQGQPVPTGITGPEVKKLVHRLRTGLQAILVGRNTALVDNPRLTARKWPGATPLRLVLAGPRPLPSHSHLLRDGLPTLVLGGAETPPSPSAHSFPIPEGEPLEGLLKRLYREANVSSILIEGGSQVLQQFLVAGLFDEIYRFVAPKTLGNGIPAPKISQELPFQPSAFANGDQLHWFRRSL